MMNRSRCTEIHAQSCGVGGIFEDYNGYKKRHPTVWTRGGEVRCGAESTEQPLLLLLLQLRCPHQATDTRAPGECVGGVVRAAQLQ